MLRLLFFSILNLNLLNQFSIIVSITVLLKLKEEQDFYLLEF